MVDNRDVRDLPPVGAGATSLGVAMSSKAPSLLEPVHSVGVGQAQVRAVVHREVRGRRTWGGTAAYKYGMTIHVAVHCSRCCCEPSTETDRCSVPALGHYVEPYNADLPDDWLARARSLAEDHSTTLGHQAQ